MKKALVLVMVSGIMVVISILAVAALSLMTVESRTAEHKLRRIRAYFAAQAGVVDRLERLRRGEIAPTTIANLPNTVNGYTVRTIVIARDNNTIDNGITYNCPAGAPSPTCVFATVDYQ
jgi:Tfp pilus assembly protein PilX